MSASDPCGLLPAAPTSWQPLAAKSAIRAANGSVAFIFVRASPKPLSWLPALAASFPGRGGPASAGVHLVQKRDLTDQQAACVRSLQPNHAVHVHPLRSGELESGPLGGRECTGYVWWLLHYWDSLPEQMLFMHESPPDGFDARPEQPHGLAAVLAAPAGFVNLLAPNAAVLRCFGPAAALDADDPGTRVDDGGKSANGGAAVASTRRVRGGTRSDAALAVRTTYELPASLHELLTDLGLPSTRCVLTPCCANFRVRRDAVRARSRADLERVDRYVRGVPPSLPPLTPVDRYVRGGGGQQHTTQQHTTRGLAAQGAAAARLNAPAARVSKEEPEEHADPAGLLARTWPTRGMPSNWPPTPCHAMEHAWHLLFGAAALLSPLPPRSSRGARKAACCAAPPLPPHDASWALPACPQSEILPSPAARHAGGEALNRAHSLFTMRLISALLPADSPCRPGGSPARCRASPQLSGAHWQVAQAWQAAHHETGQDHGSSVSQMLRTLAPAPRSAAAARAIHHRANATADVAVRCTFEL